MATRGENLTKILVGLRSGSPDVEAVALISEDGLIIASALPATMDEVRVGGMSAILTSLGTRAAAELGRGGVQEVVVRGDNGYAVTIHAGRGVILLTVTNQNAKLGLVFYDMREAITALKQVL
jgi:predicted regulator of Ras-like GTPase activity (Roadblock/LC7/MglB family)